MKPRDQTYTVQVTDEQIKYIRSLHLRAVLMWTRTSTSVMLENGGRISRSMIWECEFCHRGSFEGAPKIPHEKSCIIPTGKMEFETLNEQFIKATHGEQE